MLIENCSAHFPSTRNNQIDAATNQSKQVHCQTKVFPRLARGRLCGVEVIRTMISNRIYNIFTRVSQCFAIFETIFLRSLSLWIFKSIFCTYLYILQGVLYKTNLC